MVHDSMKCSSCVSGYHITNDECLLNQCKCTNGDAIIGTECLVHDSIKCSSCDSGYYLDQITDSHTIPDLV